jgi:c-di-AMP phosphodiesterase-like protein
MAGKNMQRHFDFIKKNSLFLAIIIFQLFAAALINPKIALGLGAIIFLVLIGAYIFSKKKLEKEREKLEEAKEKPFEFPAKSGVAIMYIQIDNYDEVFAATPEENRPELLARIDKTITQWVQSYEGFIKKFDDDKFLSAVTAEKFHQIEENKFNILEKIKEIKTPNALSVTLSIGASYGKDSLLELNRMAQNALELCLGRGGDQAVVKAEGKTYFYGGRTKEVEKYTRVRARVIAHALRDLIEEADKVLVLGHIFLDMDALGAGIGMVKAVRCLKKEGYFVLSPNQGHSVEALLKLLYEDDETQRYFMPEKEALKVQTRDTLVVIVDTHKPSFCYSQKILQRAEKVVLIDHHRRGEEFIDKAILVYLEPYASSTSEMVTEMIQYMGEEIKLSPREATALLAGISVDTRNFSFKTGVRTFDAASYLKRHGADPTLVFKLFQEDVGEFNKRAEVVKRMQILPGNIALSYYDKKCENPRLTAAHAANALLEIKGVHAAFVLVPFEDGVAISGRSLGEINVQRILEKLGGGGHLTVAGAQISNVTVEDGMKRLKEAIDEFLKEGDVS